MQPRTTAASSGRQTPRGDCSSACRGSLGACLYDAGLGVCWHGFRVLLVGVEGVCLGLARPFLLRRGACVCHVSAEARYEVSRSNHVTLVGSLQACHKHRATAPFPAPHVFDIIATSPMPYASSAAAEPLTLAAAEHLTLVASGSGGGSSGTR